MSSRVSKEKKKKKSIVVYLMLYAMGWALGYYLLYHISKLEKPPLGNTFHIITGCTLIAVFSILIIFALKTKFFPKKNRKIKSRRQVFLKDLPKSNDQ